MNDINSNLLQLSASLTSAQGSLTEMQGTVLNITQQINDELAKVAAIEADIGIAAISMRDHISLLLRQWGAQPSWIYAKITAMQMQKDENGNYVRDAKGNFIIQ